MITAAALAAIIRGAVAAGGATAATVKLVNSLDDYGNEKRKIEILKAVSKDYPIKGVQQPL